ncbi:MAG: SAM-dependent methyltransferase [Acidobacteriota bacterium]
MFELENVVPWGRSFDEYVEMFGLEGETLTRLLGCGDGPAGFNADATARGWQVVSCDPLYRFSAGQIRGRIEAVRDEVLRQTRQDAEAFVWSRFRDVDHLAAVRTEAMEGFLADYPQGQAEGRYVEAALPSLPFADDSFDVALCSHFLFLYSSQFDLEFHLAAVRELLRCAARVRIFPLLQLGGARSPHLDALCRELRRDGVRVSLATTPYEFQRGGNERLDLTRC